MRLRELYTRRDADTIATRHVELPRVTGARFIVASDIHARDDWFPASAVHRLVEAIEAAAAEGPGADAVLLAGDFIGDDETAIDWAAPILGELSLPTFAVLGNHDHWEDPVRVTDALERAGVDVLTNRVVASPGGEGLWIAGIDSCWGGNPQVDATLEQVPSDAAATLVLGHEPHIATMHRRFLHVAGHTHAAQSRVPRWLTPTRDRWLPRYSWPYVDGTYEREGGTEADGRSFVHTTSGVGYSTVSWRLNCPPEIVVLDL